MAFGLPSAEQMRDYLISQGVDPVVATERANVAARQNAAQAARTSALSIAAGAAPARAAGTAAAEAAPAIARSAMGFGERVAAAPRTVWEYLTVPAGVVRNPTTGARIPTRNVATGRMERTPDFFLPGQRAAQGTAGGLALGAGTAGVGALSDRPTAAPMTMPPADGTISGEGYGSRYDQAMADGSISGEQYGERANMLAAKALGEAAGLPMRRPSEAPVSRPMPMPPSRELQAQARAEQPSPSILSRIFSGEDYQSKGGQLRQDGRINWGDPKSAADFFRADRARRETPDAAGMKRGGAAGKPNSLHKALEIIHHLLTRGH